MKRLTTISPAKKAATKATRGWVVGRRGSVSSVSRLREFASRALGTRAFSRVFLRSVSTNAERRKGRLGRGRNAGNVAAARKEPENTGSSLFLLKQRDCRNGRSVSLSPPPLPPPLDPSVTRTSSSRRDPTSQTRNERIRACCSGTEEQGRGREEKKRGGVTRREKALGVARCEREEGNVERSERAR